MYWNTHGTVYLVLWKFAEHFVSSRSQLHNGSYSIRTQLLDSTKEQWTKRFIADFTIWNQPDGSRSFSMDKLVRHNYGPRINGTVCSELTRDSAKSCLKESEKIWDILTTHKGTHYNTCLALSLCYCCYIFSFGVSCFRARLEWFASGTPFVGWLHRKLLKSHIYK